VRIPKVRRTLVADADLRCPATGRPLRRAGDRLETDDGSRSYPVVGGVPVLIDEQRSLFRLDEFRAPAPAAPRGRLRRIAARLPSDSANPGAAAYVQALVDALSGRGGRQRVLVVGGGTVGAGLEPLLEHPALDVTETDVWLGPRTKIVCDGHDLPFADGTFDAVVCQAVLEHVLDPVRVVAEIHRVLAPDGLVYSEVPFIQQVHEGAHDFTRWTPLGHRRLLRDFDELRSGPACGPAMGLAWSIRYLAVTVAGTTPARARIVAHLVPLLTFWLARLDRHLLARPGAGDAAASTAFLGRRRAAPVPDAEIVAGYRGVNGLPLRR
jgi:SAM-dependent methyltransferase